MSTRKIIDPKQNGEKVWLKGHAKAIYMSDGSTVEDAINGIEIPSLDEYVTETELNDKGFLTEHQDISNLASRNWVESQGYAHQEDLLEISFNDIQDSPISIDDSGMINFVDESGNVGFQINEEGLRVTDVIAGEHKLSQKANASDIPSLDGYAKTSELPNFDEFAKTDDIPSLDGYAKTEDIPSLDGYASKEWVNEQEFAHQGDLLNMSFNDIQDSPITENNDGELNIVDDKGNIALKINDEGLYVKDVIAGNHTLSNKVNVSDLSNVATTGDFEQLINKPTIPTQETVEEWGFKTNDYYEKIIKENELVAAAAFSDLNERINIISKDVDDNELVTASALTDLNDRMMVLEQQDPTVTSAKITDAVSTASGITSTENGVVRAKAVYEYAASKQDMIDNEFVVATALTNLDNRIQELNSLVNEKQCKQINHGTNDTTFELTPNTLHVWNEVDSLTLTFGPGQNDIINEYAFQFTSGAIATSLILPTDIKWANDNIPIIAPFMIYQISVLNNLASVLEFNNEPPIIEFSANSYTFIAEDGMTWEEFINSAYNTDVIFPGMDSFSVYNEQVQCMTAGGFWCNLQYNAQDVIKTDVIIPSVNYTLVQSNDSNWQ